MRYLEGRRGDLRADARQLLPSANSVVSLGLVYDTPSSSTSDVDLETQGWVSRYAWGEDYHHVVRKLLYELVERIKAEAGPFDSKVCVDTAPLLERAYAHHAGLGWIGKNTCLINQQIGSWVFLGEILTSLELEPDDPAPFRCGTCTRCIDACPTDALVPTGRPDGPSHALDSTKCISYWTIELRGPIPEDDRASLGPHIFGCDICQDVCPWNRRAPATSRPEWQPEQRLPDLAELAQLTEEQFNERGAAAPIERARDRGLLRNVTVAMGNSGNRDFLPLLERLAENPDGLIREHAGWALQRIAAAQ
jgi:epoxyqueuosine reductase